MKFCRTGSCNRDELLYVSTTGDSAAYVGPYFGLYHRISQYHNNAPVYRQLSTVNGEPIYLYKDDEGDWLASNELGLNGGELLNTNKSPTPPRSGWYFGDGSEFNSDRLISVVSVSDSSDILCPVITISATSREAARRVSNYLGQFRFTGGFSQGRPIYRNFYNKYLFVHPDYPNWGVADSLDTGVDHIHSGSAPDLCPASARSAYNSIWNAKSWTWRVGDTLTDGEITVNCDSQNISC